MRINELLLLLFFNGCLLDTSNELEKLQISGTRIFHPRVPIKVRTTTTKAPRK